MFQTAYRSSSGAPNCICSLWFIYPCGDRSLSRLGGKDPVSTQPGQRPVTTWVYKPEAANTVRSFWWWAVCRSKHVEPLINFEIINSITRLHLVGYFYWLILRCTDPWILNLFFIYFIYIYIHTHTHIYIHTHTHTHIYIYTHTHTNTHTHTHTHKHSTFLFFYLSPYRFLSVSSFFFYFFVDHIAMGCLLFSSAFWNHCSQNAFLRCFRDAERRCFQKFTIFIFICRISYNAENMWQCIEAVKYLPNLHSVLP
jgi:hypothetical protein